MPLVVLINGELSDVHHRRVGDIGNRLPTAGECSSAQRGGGGNEEEECEDCEREFVHFGRVVNNVSGCLWMI
ncbi:hypothetical protein L1987_30830 [Smallanthus sonchifolius]|uniref:Uncharacterized protein n=1 Tax=Smallanthus sonchifolius TaxID=185202 RepID=A0ACB9I3A3_9ASTR|nr:hypothetical protein L1987_30830 [Smallanthus sonchifolius]